jgi:hypothetical protein
MNVQELFARLLRFVIILLATSRFAAAGTIDPDTPDARYLEFGQKFPNVVRLVAIVNCQNPKCEHKQHPQAGSAVVIAPHWVLTAAHVVENTFDQKAVKDDGTEHKLTKIIPHRSYEAGRVGWHDLALCYTPDSFQLDFYPELYTDQDELGKGITIAGYGIHGTFATGGKEGSDGKRRAGQNIIDGTADAVLFCKPKAGSKRMPLEFLIAPGDSGGGMFIGNKLAGINSFLLHDDGKADGNYGDEAAFTRVSLYADWVATQIQLHELALAARATTGGELPIEPAAK